MLKKEFLREIDHLEKKFYQDAITRPSKKSKEGISNVEFIRNSFAGVYPPEVIEEFIKKYDETMNDVYIPIPGIQRTIEKLVEDGQEVVVLTNGKNRKNSTSCR